MVSAGETSSDKTRFAIDRTNPIPHRLYGSVGARLAGERDAAVYLTRRLWERGLPAKNDDAVWQMYRGAWFAGKSDRPPLAPTDDRNTAVSLSYRVIVLRRQAWLLRVNRSGAKKMV